MSMKISRVFYSIQGEGKNTGTPSVFIQVADCNLDCSFCDTAHLWKKGEKLRFDQILNEEQIKALDDGAHLVFSGGEPLLQQGRIIQFLRYVMTTFKINPFVEIDTNGTIVPNVGLDIMVSQYNVSPKLANSNHELIDRLSVEAILFFKTRSNVFWNYVIGNEDDISDLYRTYLNSRDKLRNVFLIPLSKNREEFMSVAPWLYERCKELRLNFSTRLDLEIANNIDHGLKE